MRSEKDIVMQVRSLDQSRQEQNGDVFRFSCLARNIRNVAALRHGTMSVDQQNMTKEHNERLAEFISAKSPDGSREWNQEQQQSSNVCAWCARLVGYNRS